MRNKRQCGKCDLCCKLLFVEETDSPMYHECIYSNQPEGCIIYNTRPKSCKDFTCLWLRGLIADSKAPMISGVLCFVGNDMIANFMETSRGKAINLFAREIEALLKSGHSVKIISINKDTKEVFSKTLNP